MTLFANDHATVLCCKITFLNENVLKLCFIWVYIFNNCARLRSNLFQIENRIKQ